MVYTAHKACLNWMSHLSREIEILQAQLHQDRTELSGYIFSLIKHLGLKVENDKLVQIKNCERCGQEINDTFSKENIEKIWGKPDKEVKENV